MKRYIRHLALVGWALIAASSTGALAGSVEAVPATWRLEGYVWNHSVKLWFTGAPECQNGGIDGGGMTQDDFDRLFSLILTSKLAGRPVGVIYDASGGNCNIMSFYAP